MMSCPSLNRPALARAHPGLIVQIASLIEEKSSKADVVDDIVDSNVTVPSAR
jgi:hypothetical protein